MKSFTRAVVVAFALLSGASNAQESQAIAEAKQAATAWLALLDQGNYAGTWQQAAALFKSAVAPQAWESAARAAREPLGQVKSREVKSATFTRSLPGAPDGEYVVLQYASRFENKAGAVETVTPMREKDGSWRVSGYFVK
jgi:Protein of unknown function (DUF4019)